MGRRTGEKEKESRENALAVINSSVDRIQIESLPANRVIVASAELLHPLSLHLENPLVLNKCFTLADLPGIFICGVAAATAAMLTPPPLLVPLGRPLRAFFTPAQPYVLSAGGLGTGIAATTTETTVDIGARKTYETIVFLA